MVSFLVRRDELLLSRFRGYHASPGTASVVTEINGIEASKYVQDFAYTASFNQDADAAYNTMFFEKAFVAGGIGNGYFFRMVVLDYVIFPERHLRCSLMTIVILETTRLHICQWNKIVC